VTPGGEYFLSQDVIGPYSGKEWGKQGEKVRLISISGTMAIVKRDKDKEGFLM
jgi:hypothetical protein